MTSTKENPLTIVILGDENAGKSTLLGQFVLKFYSDPRFKEKIEKECTEMGQSDKKFAWIADRLPEERKLGHTVNVFYCKSEIASLSCTFLNVPGRRKYLKNLIAGTSCAGAALLVVSAKRGEFEAGMGQFGATREQVVIAYTMGVKQMVVAVTKMDTCNALWAEDRYQEIVKELADCLRKTGYNLDKIRFIPVSGWHGFNLTTSHPGFPWYSGPTLHSAISSLLPPKPIHDQSLRFSILESYRIGGIGTVAVGTLLAGTMVPGTSVYIHNNATTEIRSIERHHESISSASSSLFLGLNLRSISSRDIHRGMLISSSKDPSPLCLQFTAQVILLFTPKALHNGSRFILHCHTVNVPCRLEAITSRIDRRTGKVLEENPTDVNTSDAILAVLKPEKGIGVEEFREYSSLGRFVMTHMGLGVVIGVGVVKSVERRAR